MITHEQKVMQHAKKIKRLKTRQEKIDAVHALAECLIHALTFRHGGKTSKVR